MDADKFQEGMLQQREETAEQLASLQNSIDVIGDLFERLEDKLDQILSTISDDESDGNDWKPPGWKPGEEE